MFPAKLPVFQKIILRTGISSSVTCLCRLNHIHDSLFVLSCSFLRAQSLEGCSANSFHQPWLHTNFAFLSPFWKLLIKKSSYLLKSKVLIWYNHISRLCWVLTTCEHLCRSDLVQNASRLSNGEETFPASSQGGVQGRQEQMEKVTALGLWPVRWKWNNISKFVRADWGLFQRSTTAAGLTLRLSSCAVRCTLTTLSQTPSSSYRQAQSLCWRKCGVKWYTNTARHIAVSNKQIHSKSNNNEDVHNQ